jgi:hypothetical protein
MKSINRVDVLLGAISALIGASFLYVATQASASVFVLEGDIPPYLVPRYLLYLWIGFSLVICIGGLMGRGSTFTPVLWGRWSAAVAIVCLGALAMPFIGFLPAAMIMVFSLIWALGYRRLIPALLIAVGSSLSIWALLVLVARMPLPITPGLGI